jgi:hypothetical protein
MPGPHLGDLDVVYMPTVIIYITRLGLQGTHISHALAESASAAEDSTKLKFCKIKTAICQRVEKILPSTDKCP